MLSRVAESVYWLNRYLERAENVARLINVNLQLTLGMDDQFQGQWSPLINTTGDDDEFREQYDNNPSRENVLTFLLFDQEYSNSIVSCVKAARDNARRIRHVLPDVVWQQLNQFYRMVVAAAKEGSLDDVQDFCEQVRLSSHLISGAEDATASKDEAWHFARLGRFLERADKTSRIIDVGYFNLLARSSQVGTALDVVRWSAILQSASALAMYRRQYGTIDPQLVAEFLILDPSFSRSIRHCVVSAQESLDAIVGPAPSRERSDATERITRIAESLKHGNIEEIVAGGLHEFVDDLQLNLNGFGAAVGSLFFTWPAEARQSPEPAFQHQD